MLFKFPGKRNLKSCPIDDIIKNWEPKMDILLALKRKDLVLGYEGKGDFGLKTKKWTIDGAILSHEELGSTYRISLGISLDVKK